MPRRDVSSETHADPAAVSDDDDDHQVVSTAEKSGESVSDIPLQSIELLRRLIPFREVNQLAGQRSDWEGIKQTAFHGGCILLAGLITKNALLYKDAHIAHSYMGWAAVVSAIMLQAYFLSFLFMPLHECVHVTAFSTKWMNQSLGFIVGLASMRPPVHYKLYHFAHHRFTGNKDKDPELSDSLLDPDIKTLSGYLFYLSSIPFWISRPTTIIRHAMGIMSPTGEYFIATAEQKREIKREARIFCSLYCLIMLASYVTGSYALLVYWLIPTVVGQPFLRFYLLAEHTGCQLGNNMLANTRTTATYRFYQKLAWNMPFHAEHHAWPSVPFHKLPFMNEKVRGVATQDVGCNPDGRNGYFGVHKGVVDQIYSRAGKMK